MQFPRTLVEFQDQFPVRNMVGRTYATPAGVSVPRRTRIVERSTQNWTRTGERSPVAGELAARGPVCAFPRTVRDLQRFRHMKCVGTTSVQAAKQLRRKRCQCLFALVVIR